MNPIKITEADWIEEARKRYQEFGKVAFRCPICGFVATVQDYWAAKAPEGMIGYSCIGRLIGAKRNAFGGKGDGPCDYAGGGLFRMNPIHLLKKGKIETEIFDFADDPLCRNDT